MVTATQFDDARLFRPPPQQGKQDELGQEDFLTLMITQFRNQDPFEPMDNGEFLGQLAQFSTVSGIDTLNGGFADLAGALRDEQALQAANLVGHTVLAQSETGYFDGSAPLGGLLEIRESAGTVQIEITDSSGELIRRIDLGQQQPGTVRFDWDGRNSDGELMDAGQYQVTSHVVRGENIESAPTYLRASIESVTLGRFGGGMTLNLSGGGSMSLSQIYQII